VKSPVVCGAGNVLSVLSMVSTYSVGGAVGVARE
jgi:hypothetical protein